jgi:hypothetical protein
MKMAFPTKKSYQLAVGLLLGICFGFLLQKGAVTKYDIIIAQLRLKDFTVIKVMMSAVITGMLGVYALKSLGLVTLHPKSGSIGSTLIGALIFGAGFALLGYCPGTIAGAVGQGSLDALVGGVTGIIFGSGIFAVLFAKIDRSVLNIGFWGSKTIPELLKINVWAVVIPVVVGLTVFLYLLERYF